MKSYETSATIALDFAQYFVMNVCGLISEVLKQPFFFSDRMKLSVIYLYVIHNFLIALKGL